MSLAWITQSVLLFGVGLLSGFINILAGGGSLLTLPILIFLGLPAAMANGTNRLSILIQNTVAITGFHQQNVFPWRMSLLAAPSAVIGAIIGANVAVEISDALFKQLLAFIMIAVLVIMVIDPAKRMNKSSKPFIGWRRVYFILGFFVIGFHGGFIQAGVGFLVILLMLLAGFDLVETNAVKVFVIFLFSVAALAVFVIHDQIDYLMGASLGLGSACGGLLATKVAVKKGHGWIRAFVMVVVVLFAIKLVIDSLI